ncbi:MAG: TolC family protein [Deltaproteobacteria bacterium]|nr:TolC family protein [Deltaproteobacteria bacterium]
MGCQTPSQYRLEADDAAETIIVEKQVQVLGQIQDFSIERPADILRRRLLIEQELPYTGDASLGADKLKPVPHWPEKEYPKSDQVAKDHIMLEAKQPLTLTLIQALQIGAGNNAEYQTNKEEIFRAALNLDLKRNDFGFSLTVKAGSSYTYDESDSSGTGTGTFSGGARSSTTMNEDAVESVEHSGSLSVSKTLYNGAKITAALAVDLVSLLTGDGASSMGITGDTSISIPLLRGSGRHIVMEPLTQAERDVVYAIYEFERFKTTFAVDIAQGYLDVIKQLDQVDNAAQNYNNLTISANRMRSLADSGRTTELEVDRAVQEQLRARNRWITAKGLYDDRLDNLKRLIGIPPDAAVEMDRSELEQLTTYISGIVSNVFEFESLSLDGGNDPDIGVVKTSMEAEKPVGAFGMDETSAIQTGLDHRVDLRVSEGRVYDAQRTVVVMADALRAELTLLGKAQYGESRSLATVYQDDAELRTDKGIYTALFNLDLPFERTAERNAYRNSYIALERAVRDFQKMEDDIKLSIRDCLRRMEEALEGLRIQTQAVSVAEKRVKSADMFFEAGRAELRDLLDAQEALLTAKNALTAAMVDYRMAELGFQRDTGLLAIDENGLFHEYNPGGIINNEES